MTPAPTERVEPNVGVNGDHHDHDHPHEPHGHGHPHDHTHPTGIKGWFHEVFVPHSHDATDSIDDALSASAAGVRTVKISLVALAVTALAQLAVVAASGSVALLADTIHNFADALTSVPLWIAFVIGRRAATRRYTWGYHRAEDLAGLFIVAAIALSAVLAAAHAVERLVDPRPLEHLGWVLTAGVVGFLGNEAVAIYRIRVGRRIGSAALVADGLHARTDGFTSLAVVLGALGVMVGLPLADPIVGLLIAAAIVVLLWSTARDIGRRLLDGVDPSLTERARHALSRVAGVDTVDDLRLRWTGHVLHVTAVVTVAVGTTVDDVGAVERDARHRLDAVLPHLGMLDLVARTTSRVPG